MSDTNSIDSNESSNNPNSDSNSVHSLPSNLAFFPHTEINKVLTHALTRTSTIVSNIREDNKFAKTQTVPNPSFDPYVEEKIGTAAVDDDDDNNDTNTNIKNTNNTHLSSNSSSSTSTLSTNTEPEIKDTGEFNVYDLYNKPPDKGFWAWTSALCVMSINTFSWGANSVFGVYLNYYVSTNYFPNASMEQYVMIGGLTLGLSFMTCTITNTLCRRYYYKYVMSVGTAITFLSYWLASISHNVIQLIMFQGFLMSIGFALVAGSSFLILPTWFLKKRSIAQGISSAGGGLGGIIFSRPVDQIIKKYLDDPKYKNDQNKALKLGMSWALRMQSLVCGFMLVLSIILVRTFRPLKDPKAREKNLLADLSSFLLRFDLIKEKSLICVILWNMIYGLAYTILLFSLSSYASTIGLSYSQGSNVTTIQSVAQTVGRPVLGLISDKYGRINITVICTLLIAIFVFFFWIFITTYGELIAFAFITGFLLGVNWVNFAPMTADIVGGGGVDLNHAISIEMFTGGMPLIIAELVGLKLKRPNMNKQFLYCQILVGISCVISAIVLMPFREWKVKRILSARRKLIIDDNYDLNSSLEKEKQINRLDALLDNTFYAYTIRMFYPISV